MKPKVIAEVGCNHIGEFNISIELLNLAKKCGADVAKFQKRNNREFLFDKQYNISQPNTYIYRVDIHGEKRELIEFGDERHKNKNVHCNSIGIEYSTSVWDDTSANEMMTFTPKLPKVPSAYSFFKIMLP